MPFLSPQRLAALSPRERLFLAAGLAALLAFLIYLLMPAAEEPPVELGEEAAMPAPEFAPAPPPAASAPLPPAAPPASVAGLVLHGVLGGGPGGGAAIIRFPDGSQRAVRVGREFLPGLTLKEVGLRHALIATAGGDMRLEFNKPAEAVAGTASAPAAPSPAEASAEQRRRRETLQYRMGLAPRTEGGRVVGYAMRPGASLPLFEQAGLRPGDVIVRVNGKALKSSEKVLELSDELATSYTAEIEYIRGGRRMKGSVPVNKKP
ncbi:MAG TPA: type II secretion system protein N, partial [Allosphingosinicella sp.]